MSFRAIAKAWNQAFFEPQSPVPLALYRIFFGLLVMAKLILFWPDWLNWFGVHGWVTLVTMHKMEGGTRINLFDVLPQNDLAIDIFFWAALLVSFSLTLGFMTRTSSILVWLALTSIDERELFAMHSGDTFLRVTSFFLIFAPASAAISVDRLIRIWRGKEEPELKPRVVWAQRMIQYLAALVYFVTAWWKATGTTWVNGTAIYYVHHLEQFQRFPLPSWVDNPLLIKLQTWFGLTVEFALGTLIWIKECRYWALLAGVILHLTLEYTMNVPLFQFIMMATFILFIDPVDLERFWAAVRNRIVVRLGPPVRLVYEASEFEALRRINLIRAIDILRRVDIVEDRTVMSNFSSAVRKNPYVLVDTPQGAIAGFGALLELGRVIPLLWPLRLIRQVAPNRATLDSEPRSVSEP
ncbi:MAG: HTTM domain-containing protein [Acidobacteriaceae bacterium]|nr:HTTM domain-containing protein [Acidobacteriaceae bacterium]